MNPLPDSHRPEPLAALLSSALFAPDQVVELRAIGVTDGYGRRFASAGYFDPDHRVELAEAALALTEKAQGVYVTLNPINPALLARRCNRVAKADTGDLTRDKDVVARRWLLIDTDPERVAGVSATDAEKEAARVTAHAVRDFLRGRGWPDPILADSGNGFHLLYRIDLPADGAGRVQRVLAAIAGRFDTDRAKIDRSVYNAARICKLPYTWARKGDGTPDRPHRRSALLEVPPTGRVEDPAGEAAGWHVVVVPTELIGALADEGSAGPTPAKPDPAPPPVPELAISDAPKSYAHRLLVDRWLADRGVGFRRKPEPDGKGRTIYALDACPFDPAHGPDAAVMQAPDGKLSAHCFHNGCAGRGWKDFKARIGKPDPRHCDPPLGSTSAKPQFARQSLGQGARRPVEITTEEFRVNDEVAEELAKEDALFQRNGELVRVVVVEPEESGPPVSTVPRIEAVPAPALRDTISRRVEFYKTVMTNDGEAVE